MGNGDFRLTYHDAEEIADEIDAELLGICSSAELEIGRYAWVHGVPAPVDADGEVVPLTTKVMYDDDGEEREGDIYESLTWSRARGRWYFGVTNGTLEVASLHLHRPDSVERLEEDVESMLRNGTCAYFGRSGRESCEGCQASAIDNLSCSHVIVRDVLRRAKAFLKRDAKAVVE